jgi:hypothetical protein
MSRVINIWELEREEGYPPAQRNTYTVVQEVDRSHTPEPTRFQRLLKLTPKTRSQRSWEPVNVGRFLRIETVGNPQYNGGTVAHFERGRVSSPEGGHGPEDPRTIQVNPPARMGGRRKRKTRRRKGTTRRKTNTPT